MFGTIWGKLGTIQETFGAIQGTFGAIQGTVGTMFCRRKGRMPYHKRLIVLVTAHERLSQILKVLRDGSAG
jgi:hypothetical protein